SATMTASSDNFLNAFAIYLQASAAQLGLLTALPQFFGALMQLLSVWLSKFFPRRRLVYNTAIVQTCVVAAISLLALPLIDIGSGPSSAGMASKVPWLIGLV